MTDLELVRLCAEAMGIAVFESVVPEYTGRVWITGDDHSTRPYDPLHDDAQAMALVKKMDLCIMRRGALRLNGVFDPISWQVSQYVDGRTDAHLTNGYDLNRAIVECVAKMRRAKVAT
jgi:hypothetical protein